MRIGVVDIPGMDVSLVNVLKDHFHNTAELINLDAAVDRQYDLVMIPPSTLYSDSEELKRRVAQSKLYNNLIEYSAKGGFVVGIQSGFQILCAAGLLEGGFVRTSRTSLVNGMVNVTSELKRSPLTYLVDFDKPIRLYLSHALGYYRLSEDQVHKLQLKGQILMRYCDERGFVSKESNPDGSTSNIAAICNTQRNVFGITPNPTVKSYFQHRLDGFELMDSFFKMITR
jgi:Phosphoribosylformylglycinamidine (FGAM) synthase, glutamine amidotransferase domain